MFVILHLSNTYHMPGLLERNLDSETYSGYVYENKAEDTKQMLIELYTIIDDREYMNYLQSNNLELLIGSKFTLGNRDYSQTQEFEKLTEDWKVIYTMLMENGLPLKRGSIKVYIHSIEVIIRPQSISDEKQIYNEATGLHTYPIYSGMPIDFKEHELDAFLHDNRKVIEISAKVSVQTATERVGTLVIGEKGELWG